MELDDKNLEADLETMKQKEKLELEILKLSYEITEKKKNIFKKSEWAFKDYIAPILGFSTLVVSISSIFISFKIQSKQIEMNSNIQSANIVKELFSWVADGNAKKRDLAMQQLKYYGVKTLPVYLDAIITDSIYNSDNMADNISYIINSSDKNDEKKLVIYALNSYFERQVFQKLNTVQEMDLEAFYSLLNNRIYPVFEKIDYSAIPRDSLNIYNKKKIDAANAALRNRIKQNQTVDTIQVLLTSKAN